MSVKKPFKDTLIYRILHGVLSFCQDVLLPFLDPLSKETGLGNVITNVQGWVEAEF
jgi:hypothetical protein